MTRPLAAALLVVLALAPRAQSQEDDAIMLARSCVSERGWLTESDDCAAIAEVVRSRVARRGGSFADALRALAPRLHGGTITDRVWLLELGRDAHRPRHLGRARWEGMRRDAWIATLDEAERIIAGEVPSPCASPPAAWGSRLDVARRARISGRRWRSVPCGDTRNLFGGWGPAEVDPE